MAETLILTQPKTVADYMRLPEGTPIQLIAGEFIMSPSPLTIHQRIAMRLGGEMFNLVASSNLGEVYFAPLDVFVGPRDVYQPDIIFVSRERLSIIEENGIYGPPDMLIEILSPSTAGYDLIQKKDAYESFGVREYWIADPKHKTIECFVNSKNGFESTFLGGTGIVCSHVLPKFCVDVEALFKR